MKFSLKNKLLIATGWFFVGLGILGIFLPLLPTTVFLIIASACFYKSSPRFYFWLLNNRYLGVYIKNYREKKGIPLRAKILGLILLNGTIAYSLYFFSDKLMISITLLLVAIGVSIYLISLNTITEND